jgi:hypothetical protein
MRVVGLLAAAIAAGTLLGHPLRTTTGVKEPTRSVWDSVYTDSQALRGDSLYQTACGKCHSATLAGTDDGTPLTGASFLSNWNGQTLGDLYDRIRNSMPPDNPSSIPRGQVADILAYMLAGNHFPSGRVVLSDDAARLKDVKFLQSRP